MRYLLLAGLLAPAAAFAQDRPASEPLSIDLDALPEASSIALGEESPELRALRLAELELFGAADRAQDAPHLGEPPSLLTSDSPPPPRVTELGTDLGYLEGLTMPDIPVRWERRVVRFLEFFRNDPRGRDLMAAWLRRANRYGAVVREQLGEQGLPSDLLYVAMVESGFDPLARSPAAAVGMWQFVSRTGTEYGLRQDRWVDERRSPSRSTDAGGRYLKQLYDRLGTWELALAAYNMGYGALLRAIRKYNTNDYWLLAELEAGLPFETTIYVSKIMAVAIIGRNPERFGFGEIAPDPVVAYDEVSVPGGTPLAQIARAAGSTQEEIATLNPELLRTRTPPDERVWTVRIPPGASDRFESAFATARRASPANRAYVVRFGEDLATIAQRHRTAISALRTLNDLSESDQPMPGETLLVPAVEPAAPEPEDIVAAVPEETFVYPDRRRVFYRVMSGDDAEEIAQFFEVNEGDLARWNNLVGGAALHRGMILQLFVRPELDLTRAVVLSDNDVRVLVVGSEEFFEHHEAQQGRVRFRYRVEEGDTIESIAQRFELSTGSVARINQFAQTTELAPGDTILVYAPRERVPRAILAELERPIDPITRPEESEAPTEATADEAAPESERDDTEED